MTEQLLEGKVALVTGAGRGIGREIALSLARDGAKVVVQYLASEIGARETVAAIVARGGQAFICRADIAIREDVAALFALIDREAGQLDIVVNNAGVSGGGNLADLDDAQLALLLGVNMLGPLYVASEAAKRIGAGGRIINLGSTMSEFPMAGAGVYSAAKAALKSFTQSWALELGAKGATVNMVIPGPTSPGMMDAAPAQFHDFYAKASPFGRIGTAAEIAAAVSFLASPAASWINGAHILANGGARS